MAGVYDVFIRLDGEDLPSSPAQLLVSADAVYSQVYSCQLGLAASQSYRRTAEAASAPPCRPCVRFVVGRTAAQELGCHRFGWHGSQAKQAASPQLALPRSRTPTNWRRRSATG